MAISPFSAQHDYEVQEYSLQRRAYLASERRRKAETKTREKAFEKDRRMSLQSAMREFRPRTWQNIKPNFTDTSEGHTPWSRNTCVEASQATWSVVASTILRFFPVRSSRSGDREMIYKRLLEWIYLIYWDMVPESRFSAWGSENKGCKAMRNSSRSVGVPGNVWTYKRRMYWNCDSVKMSVLFVSLHQDSGNNISCKGRVILRRRDYRRRHLGLGVKMRIIRSDATLKWLEIRLLREWCQNMPPRSVPSKGVWRNAVSDKMISCSSSFLSLPQRAY